MSPELSAIIVAVLGTNGILGGIMYWLHVRSKVRLIRAQADAQERIKRLEIQLKRVENEATKAASDEHQTDDLIETLNELIKMLGRSIERIDDMNKRFSTLQTRLKEMEDNVNDGYTAMIERFNQAAKHMVDSTVEQREILEKSRRAEFIRFANEFASVMMSEQRVKEIDKNLFVLPSPEHPGWKYRYARPTHGKIRFFHSPWREGETYIQGIEIAEEGELVQVIENYVHGWHVIARVKNGFPFPGIGYVDAYSVKLNEIEPKRDSKPVPIVTTPLVLPPPKENTP